MPIYEFYCEDCNTIFNFFSSRINTEKRPMCPKCRKKILERHISRFSVLKGIKEQDDMEMPAMDEGKLQKAMSLLEQESKNLNEDDPRQAAQIMRKLFDTTGMNPGSGMEEALRRMETGEDPDKIEEEMEEFAGEELFKKISKGSPKSGEKPPIQDETLYSL